MFLKLTPNFLSLSLATSQQKAKVKNVDYIMEALRIIHKFNNRAATLLIIEDLELLFEEQADQLDKQTLATLFMWLLESQREGILDVVLSCTDKSLLPILSESKFVCFHSVNNIVNE
jgi:hypothetical protein